MSLQNKVVLITGGGSGMGANTADALIAAGAKVILNGRRSEVLKNTANKIDATGKNIAWVVGDIGQAETRQQILSLAKSRFGGVDILFNNAGIFEPKPFLEHTEADLEGYLNLLRGYFFLSQAAIAEMQQRGGGAIINTGSMWALHAIAATPCSAASTAKGAVHALTKNLAIEFAPHNIRVNAIAPAVVETPLFDSLLTAEQLASFNNFHPLGRNGQAQDITSAVLFLADGERSGWITGVVLPVDGGVTAGRN
ncbi:MAG: SDR family oxidoreductase [Pleurocapsa sp. MO_226.B13]|nr:SDR family oxidoreductase [Pleurocapsa sp. MO_226.B13]